MRSRRVEKASEGPGGPVGAGHREVQGPGGVSPRSVGEHGAGERRLAT